MLKYLFVITPGLSMLISYIIDSIDIGIRISPENPISLEVQYQHITFPTHILLHGTKYCRICLLVVAHTFILFSNLRSYCTLLSSSTSSFYSFLFLPPLFSSTVTLCLSPYAMCALLYLSLMSSIHPAYLRPHLVASYFHVPIKPPCG